MLRNALLAGLLSMSIFLNLSAQRSTRIADAVLSSAPYQQQTHLRKTADSPSSEESYLVQFEGAPLLIQQASGGKQSAQSLASVHAQFQTDVGQIALIKQVAGEEMMIHDVFSSVFNGALLSAPAHVISDIEKLPYVKDVFVDGTMVMAGDSEVTTSLYPENRAYQNPQTGFTGAGVTVAVIDSGVDYTHPDLIQGYLGGYDYVNNDPDPMDDNGHGTHVAGILAGNGAAFKGAAPDVGFLALKVLDASGSGFDSAVIRAIEHAINPDGDPTTDDAVDIINLSISSLSIGNADHPVTIAVEHAVQAGIVCIVAAGNRGEEGRASITAPGNAVNAITVGASNQREGIAAFSSQGPSGSIDTFASPFFGLKPDLLAPGVQIQSTWIGGAYRTLDGTSMASPYVAGLAARMMQEHPEWDPMIIKARLMQQTQDLGEPIWVQGAGVVDLSKEIPFVVSPACLDLGLVYQSQSLLERYEPLTITNFSSTASSYSIQLKDVLPAGIQATLELDSFQLQPGESIQVGLDLTVNPKTLSALDFPEGYVGFIEIAEASGTVSVPFSVFKTTAAHIQFAEDADHVVLKSHAEEQAPVYAEVPNLTSLFVEPGTYDLFVQFEDGRYTVVQEALDVEEASVTHIHRDAAIHALSLEAVDINQNRIEPLSYEMAVRTNEADPLFKRTFTRTGSESFPYYFSFLSDNYDVQYRVIGFSDEKDYYEIPLLIEGGINQDLVLKNDPVELRRFKYHYALPEGIDQVYFVPWNTERGLTIAAEDVEISALAESGFRLNPPFQKSFYTSWNPLQEQEQAGFGHSVLYAIPGGGQKLAELEPLIQAAPMILNEQSARLHINNMLREVDATAENEYALFLGSGDGYWAGELDNSASRIRIKGPVGGGLFRGEWGEAFKGGGHWEIWKEGVMIDHDTLEYIPGIMPYEDRYAIERTVEPGTYTIFVRNAAFLSGTEDRVHGVELHFKTDRADPDPPRLNGFYGVLKQQEEALVIDAIDVCNWCSPDDAWEQLTSVQLWVKKTAHGDWIQQDVIEEDSLYFAAFSGAYSDQYYALRVRLEDSFGNSMDYYTIDESHRSTDPRSVHVDDKLALPEEMTMKAPFPNPSAGTVFFEYALPEPADVQIFVYDMLGRNVMRKAFHQSAGTYDQALDFSSFANGLYIIQIQAGVSVETQQVMKVR